MRGGEDESVTMRRQDEIMPDRLVVDAQHYARNFVVDVPPFARHAINVVATADDDAIPFAARRCDDMSPTISGTAMTPLRYFYADVIVATSRHD